MLMDFKYPINYQSDRKSKTREALEQKICNVTALTSLTQPLSLNSELPPTWVWEKTALRYFLGIVHFSK